jgi:hypothetical protein
VVGKEGRGKGWKRDVCCLRVEVGGMGMNNPIPRIMGSALIQGTRCTQSAIKTNVQWSHNIYNELELLAITSFG